MTSIDHCGRTIAGDVVAFDICWEGSLPAEAALVWSMVVTDEVGHESLVLSHARRGEVIEQYAVDPETGRREDVEPDADLSDREITVRFPANIVGVAVECPVWKAVISADGDDLASKLVPLA